MRDQLMALMRVEEEVNRFELAAAVGAVATTPAYLIAFNEARNALVGEGIDFHPVRRRAGVYHRADAADTLRRVGNDCRASRRKLERGRSKAHSIKAAAVPPELRQSVQRMKDKTELLLSTAIQNTYRRNFQPKPSKRPDNPRVSAAEIERRINAAIKDAVQKVTESVSLKEEVANV